MIIMITLKNALAGLAFVFAIGAAYASTNSYYLPEEADGIHSLAGCITGILDDGRVRGIEPGECWTTFTTNGRCTVTVFFVLPESLVPAFDPYGSCRTIGVNYIFKAD